MTTLRQSHGSAAERAIQELAGTRDRAERFYGNQVLDHLNEKMQEFVAQQEILFIATSDSTGACDSSLRAGPPGFIQVLARNRLAYPEYRGNGVLASLANIAENPHIGLVMVDFVQDVIGLHVNGRASIAEDAPLRGQHPGLTVDPAPGRRPERWVVVEVEEAYIHCSKHIPQLARPPKSRFWRRSRKPRRNGGNFFGTSTG